MRVKREYSESELLHKAAAYCSTAEHCISDVREKLTLWNSTDEISNRIVERLLNEKFIDESRYATAFAKDKFRFSRWGKVKIKNALLQKRINPTQIEEAIGFIEEDNYQENLFNLLTKKRSTLKDSDYQIIKGKLFRFAASRGYESGLILKTISEILKHDTDYLE